MFMSASFVNDLQGKDELKDLEEAAKKKKKKKKKALLVILLILALLALLALLAVAIIVWLIDGSSATMVEIKPGTVIVSLMFTKLSWLWLYLYTGMLSCSFDVGFDFIYIQVCCPVSLM